MLPGIEKSRAVIEGTDADGVTAAASCAGVTMWIDHIAIAVTDLEQATAWYQNMMGFTLIERRVTHGQYSGMQSAVMRNGELLFVLVKGDSPQSQVSQYVEHYGPGVHHIAIGVNDLAAARARLEARGVSFNTSMIEGDGIRQFFTMRDPVSGMMYEFIERKHSQARFSDEMVQQLFEELEKKGAY